MLRSNSSFSSRILCHHFDVKRAIPGRHLSFPKVCSCWSLVRNEIAYLSIVLPRIKRKQTNLRACSFRYEMSLCKLSFNVTVYRTYNHLFIFLLVSVHSISRRTNFALILHAELIFPHVSCFSALSRRCCITNG